MLVGISKHSYITKHEPNWLVLKRLSVAGFKAPNDKLAPSAVHELAAVSAGACQCLVEWEDAAGAKMRWELKGTAMPDLAALSRSFWNRGS